MEDYKELKKRKDMLVKREESKLKKFWEKELIEKIKELSISEDQDGLPAWENGYNKGLSDVISLLRS